MENKGRTDSFMKRIAIVLSIFCSFVALPSHFASHIVALVLSSLTLATGCSTISDNQAYQGDGEFVDRGALALTERYTLLLDTIRTDEIGERVYDVGPLPEETYIWGLWFDQELVDMTTRPRVVKPGLAEMELRVENTTGGEPIISTRGSLSETPWNISQTRGQGSFVYCHPYLKAKAGQTYRVTVRVIKPDSYGYEAKLKCYGGGMK